MLAANAPDTALRIDITMLLIAIAATVVIIGCEGIVKCILRHTHRILRIGAAKITSETRATGMWYHRTSYTIDGGTVRRPRAIHSA